MRWGIVDEWSLNIAGPRREPLIQINGVAERAQ